MGDYLNFVKLIQIYFTLWTPELALIFKLSRDTFRNEKIWLLYLHRTFHSLFTLSSFTPWF